MRTKVGLTKNEIIKISVADWLLWFYFFCPPYSFNYAPKFQPAWFSGIELNFKNQKGKLIFGQFQTKMARVGWLMGEQVISRPRLKPC